MTARTSPGTRPTRVSKSPKSGKKAKAAEEAARRYFDAVDASMTGLDLYLGDNASPLYSHELIGTIVTGYLGRFRNSLQAWRNRLAFRDRFHISQAESGFPVFQNVLDLDNDAKSAKKRLTAMPDADTLRREMVDFILSKKQFPSGLQKVMAERLYLEEIESGSNVVHRNTGLRYSVVEVGDEEVLLSPESSDMQDLMMPVDLFRGEFVASERYSAVRSRSRGRGRGRRTANARNVPSGPKVKGRIKKLVPERGFGFVRGDDGKEVFFHRSGLGGADYDSLSEGDVVEYVVQEGPRGPRAENVRSVTPEVG